MHKQWSFSVLKQASALLRFHVRLKSTNVRPTAPLGSRVLTNPDDIFKHNMWDHVQWTEEDKEAARQRAEENSRLRLPLTEQGKFVTNASQYWDHFYEVHQDKFFKDRRWLFLEFPELLPSSVEKRTNICLSHQEPTPEPNEVVAEASFFPGQQTSFRILEVGCGVGNSVFPILNAIKNTDSFFYCCDFSPRAIQLVKDHPDYDDSVCHAFVHDICKEETSFPFPPQSLDVILAVFVLSSIHPQRMQRVVNHLSMYLKPGGVFLFRDYGRYDFSQLRFKKGRCLSDNFYTRGDGTCVYFFTKEEVHDLFSKAGLEEIQNLEDKRLQVNRGKKVVMRRVWMQSKYRKPPPSSPS
ncbi:PREDICTED: methyltransferase-like protein 8 [Cyprinodon variegatus]|uniref:methyltransferase-like protein 8 n=1 Tax=Cyprinodon variegatus TaxID=28743 RepID=UPI0007427721|nr:PREDICTED: methyltransferase-like protein 8 [Cyprinodon variegatus]